MVLHDLVALMLLTVFVVEVEATNGASNQLSKSDRCGRRHRHRRRRRCSCRQTGEMSQPVPESDAVDD